MIMMIIMMMIMIMMMMKVPPGVRDVVFESRFEAVTTQVSEEMMASPDTPFPFGKVTVSRKLSPYCHVIVTCQMVDLSVESARAALLHPEVQSIITTETVDVVVTLPGREGLVAL